MSQVQTDWNEDALGASDKLLAESRSLSLISCFLQSGDNAHDGYAMYIELSEYTYT